VHLTKLTLTGVPCKLKIKHRWVKQLSHIGKVQEVTVANIYPKFVINNNCGKLPGKGISWNIFVPTHNTKIHSDQTVTVL